MPYLTVYHGNPHSRTHMYGWETEAAVEHARQVSISQFAEFYLSLDLPASPSDFLIYNKIMCF